MGDSQLSQHGASELTKRLAFVYGNMPGSSRRCAAISCDGLFVATLTTPRNISRKSLPRPRLAGRNLANAVPAAAKANVRYSAASIVLFRETGRRESLGHSFQHASSFLRMRKLTGKLWTGRFQSKANIFLSSILVLEKTVLC